MSDTSFYDVKMFILTKATQQEITELYDYARARTAELGALNAAQFKKDDPVCFDGGRQGMISGTFVRLLQKNAIIKDTWGREWRVAPHFLQKP